MNELGRMDGKGRTGAGCATADAMVRTDGRASPRSSSLCARGHLIHPAVPDCVPGPFGKPLTFDMLPPPETRRWVVRRKAEVLSAINGGLLTIAEACARYKLSPEELELWQKAIDHAGVPGLRVTRIQLYRDDFGLGRSRRMGRQHAEPDHDAVGLS